MLCVFERSIAQCTDIVESRRETTVNPKYNSQGQNLDVGSYIVYCTLILHHPIVTSDKLFTHESVCANRMPIAEKHMQPENVKHLLEDIKDVRRGDMYIETSFVFLTH
jgi:hypothetical protein